MASELITTAQIVAGTGALAWVADKLLGPSAEAVGDQIKIYASARVEAIFARIAQKRSADQLASIPPAFAVAAIQRASISDDDTQITEMWANLLIAASEQFESRMTVYADILSQIGPNEARLLRDTALRHDLRGAGNVDNLEINLRIRLNALKLKGTLNFDDANDAVEFIRRVFDDLPVVFERLVIAVGGNEGQSVGLIEKAKTVSCLVLERQNLFKKLTFEYNAGAIGPSLMKADLFVPTDLGLDFLSVCEGGLKP